MKRLQHCGVVLSLFGILVLTSHGQPQRILGLNPMAWFGWTAVAGILFMPPFVLLEQQLGTHHPLTIATGGVVLFLLSLFASIGAYLGYGLVQRTMVDDRNRPVLYPASVCNAGLAWWLLDEKLSMFHTYGAGLVLFGYFSHQSKITTI